MLIWSLGKLRLNTEELPKGRTYDYGLRLPFGNLLHYRQLSLNPVIQK